MSNSVSQDLRLSEDGASIELERGQLFEDDGPAAGFSYRPNEELLKPNVWIKKELLIPQPAAGRAVLLVAPGGELKAVINGQPQTLTPEGKAGNYWQAYSFPAQALQPGKNEFVLSGTGKIWIARDDEFAAGSRTRVKHPNRSARSGDGGKTWDYDHLSASGDLDGEYYLRVHLDQVRPRGSLTLPVIDAGNLANHPLPAPVSEVGPIRVGFEGESTGMVASVRSGSTYVPQEKLWSAWQTIGNDGLLPSPTGRYLQVKLEFSASEPSVSGTALAAGDLVKTPRLKHVRIEASPKRAGTWTENVRVRESHNEQIVRTAIPFEYEPFDHPRLKALRQERGLDAVVAGAKSEWELITRLAAWTAGQWERGHLQEIYPAWDALDILKPHADGKPVGGFCQQYNLVFLQACESFGLTGRAVSIGPGEYGAKIRGGHEVVEIWSNEFKKWVYVDGNTAWHCNDVRSGVPLSLWELRQRQLQTLRGEPTPAIQLVTLAETKHAWTGLGAWPPFVELRLIPRSNFLEQPRPLPLNQGMRGWFWTGHYVWTDPACPASHLYSLRVSQRGNWDWTLNQARFYLEPTTEPGSVRVHLDTQTPGFDTFLAEIDNRDKQPVTTGFVWKLHTGSNRLQVRPRNIAGREGIASWVILDSE